MKDVSAVHMNGEEVRNEEVITTNKPEYLDVKKPLDNLQGLKLCFVAANEGRADPPPKSVKLFIAHKRLFCQEKYFLLLA